MDLTGKVAIVTGVSKGLAGLRSRPCWPGAPPWPAGAAPHPADLDHDRFQFFECDVRNRLGAWPKPCTRHLRELGPEVHVLVNNAGLGIAGPVDGFSDRRLAS